MILNYPVKVARLSFVSGSFRVYKFISDPPDSQDILRLILIFFYGHPQAADMDIHSAGLHESLISPDIIQKLIPRVNPAGMLCEESQQF